MANIDKAADNLSPLALAVVTIAVIVSVGTITLTQMEPVSWETSNQFEETDQPASLPSNYTVASESNEDFKQLTEDSETVIFEDSSQGTNTTLSLDSYNVYLEQGKIEVESTSETSSYSSTEDTFYFQYQYEQKTSASSYILTGVDSLGTFADFFTVVIILGIAAVLFILLKTVRRNGSQVTA